MELHDFLVSIILSSAANYFLGGMGILLTASYILWALVATKFNGSPLKIRRTRLIIRGLNWGIFGLIFILFGSITGSRGLDTFRATARIALFSLMAAEISYQVGLLSTFSEGIKKWKSTRLSQSSSRS